jgi:hypothetical protein
LYADVKLSIWKNAILAWQSQFKVCIQGGIIFTKFQTLNSELFQNSPLIKEVTTFSFTNQLWYNFLEFIIIIINEKCFCNSKESNYDDAKTGFKKFL